MIKTATNQFAPILAAGIYGLNPEELGTTLMFVMACAVITNQVWRLITNIRNGIRSPEADTSALTSTDQCGRYRREIGRTLDQLRQDDTSQDRSNKERFDTIDAALKSIRSDMREDNKEVTTTLNNLTLAVGELIGKDKK